MTNHSKIQNLNLFPIDRGSNVLSSHHSVFVCERDSSRWLKALEEIDRYRELDDDWDGMSADAPPTEIVESAIRLANELWIADFPAPTSWIATPSGTVGFEWRSRHFYLEIEVVSPDRIEWMRIIGPDGKAEHGFRDTSAKYQDLHSIGRIDSRLQESDVSTRSTRFWNSWNEPVNDIHSPFRPKNCA